MMQYEGQQTTLVGNITMTATCGNHQEIKKADLCFLMATINGMTSSVSVSASETLDSSLRIP